jgi:FdhD protein
MKQPERIDDLLSTSKAVCLVKGLLQQRIEEVCVERVIHLLLNDEPIGHFIASPSQLKELGVGFVISEGIAAYVEDVVVDGDEVKLYAKRIIKPAEMVTGSSGGLSVRAARTKISSSLTIDREDVFKVIAGIVSALWERTGGAHCSVLFSGKKLIVKSSDVGRHNTVDKVIGHAILNGIDLSTCVLGCTGRQPAGMVSKAVNAGIPIIVSKAATTDEGISLADRAGLTLVCRVKDESFCVYTHPERIRGIYPEDLVKS